MISAIQRLEDGTINLTITIPWTRVEDTKKTVVDELAKEVELPGFRKGKAPKKVVESAVDKEKVRDEILKKLLPQTYLEATSEHKLNPIVTPLIHVGAIDEGKDWQYTAQTCEAPQVELGSYKENVKKVTAKSKIAIPGKEPQPASFEDITKELLKSVKVKIPKIVIEREVQRLLSQTLDEIKRLGLTLDQYLQSTGKTSESLRSDYEEKASNDIKIEFALQEIAEEEKITVSDSEINNAIKKAKNDDERKNLEANRYLLASVIRQQKTLEFLKNL